MSLQQSVRFVLQREDPTGKCIVTVDSGGVTCCGIALRFHPELTEADIRRMTWDRAGQIYTDTYWAMAQCALVPEWLQTALLDSAVNQGAHIARVALQEAVYVPADGILGSVTLSAIAAMTQKDVLARYVARRIAHYALDTAWPQAHSNWTERAVAAALAAY